MRASTWLLLAGALLILIPIRPIASMLGLAALAIGGLMRLLPET